MTSPAPAQPAAPAPGVSELRERIQGYLQRETGAPVAVGELTLLTGGNAREMWAFDATIGGEVRRLLLRKDPPGGGPHAIRFQLERNDEFRIMQLAHEAGVPVARVYWLIEDRSILGEAGFIMERLDGETISRKLLREPRYAKTRETATFDLGAVLARLHGIDYSTLAIHRSPAGEHPVVEQLEEYSGYLDEVDDPRPALELGMRWLRDNMPKTWRTALVHSDFRNGNLMLDENGVVAVLDWETVHIGDPMEDLGWLCVRSWRYGEVGKPAGGFGSREQLLDGYESVGGFRPDMSDLHYWEVLGTVKWGILCCSNPAKRRRQSVSGGVMAMAGRHLEGMAQNRRACEMEYDVIQLLRGS